MKNIFCNIILFCLFTGHAGYLRAQAGDTLKTVTDSIINLKYFPRTDKILRTAVPVAMIAFGVLSLESGALKILDYSTRNELLEDNLMWGSRWDNYLQFSPAALAFGMKLGGVKSRHSLKDMAVLYALSTALETSVVYTAKRLTGRERPDGSNRSSFPSGHTATAFVAAEFLYQEYRDRSVWISIGGYFIASLVGTSRVYNNKHWVSDVVTGAGIGVLSARLVYRAYPALQNIIFGKSKKHQAFLFPYHENGAWGLNFSCSLSLLE
ncbi:MAG: phosphatase PAP2 family protein [Dysgonamonadaceae bacterium]|nr:phosphatase PAP2 family protein [Dysgonamonadaceae bacterium]